MTGIERDYTFACVGTDFSGEPCRLIIAQPPFEGQDRGDVVYASECNSCVDGLVDAYGKVHSAALNFLNEYEAYRESDAVSFAPSPEVLEAFRKAVKG